MSHSNSPSSLRRVLITGAAGALGSAVVTKFVTAGDAVIAIHSPAEKPPAIAGVEWMPADLTDRKSVFDLFSRVGELDAVIHCAGGFRFAMIEALTLEDIKFLVALNFEAAFYVAGAAIPVLRKKKEGTLLFISAAATLNPAPGMSAYAATKAAVNAMVVSLGAELKNDGVRVNAVMPSTIDTPANRKSMPNADATKWVPAEEIAELLYDLTLPKSRSITGALIPITGRV
jgi:NAD(P)-dependent dehydrogenase (short-subunit alcohol dehydrogenase family)